MLSEYLLNLNYLLCSSVDGVCHLFGMIVTSVHVIDEELAFKLKIEDPQGIVREIRKNHREE